ncbi:alpha,alpha-trehalase TreA [Dyadobacter sandarakinus]|uniref:Alpha,alpha-trehalase TreA n=1 Tax=Dyadobacter sandarakinus TaxID=2747268 RepID=A0ABX7IE51_9BACT|nr:alpha,alpha-trehalase TreA [Dyadobacter sandarakinus]QRR03802.1 alpha,alpha-trehalase TreA [Dyadobacter sandarakinus]
MFGFVAPSFTYGHSHVSPEDLYGSLFRDVQNSKIFKDSKTFADSLPIDDPVLIIERYHHEKSEPGFNLSQFVEKHFQMPAHYVSTFHADTSKPVSDHIERLWPVLTRQPDYQERGGSLIPLPHPYVVPGGRFREIYYWDSYFTMLGLRESGKKELIGHMVENFAYLINSFGYVPTANRTYYLSRSQPPFFSLMVRLYAEMEDNKILTRFLPQLQKEYNYWMNDDEAAKKDFTAYRRVVHLPGGKVLNRYWDDRATPRPESYREDVELADAAFEKYGTPRDQLYRHIRAAAESGWDFSSRWFGDENDFSTIHTTDILPVDLNCLLYHLEKTLAEAYLLGDNRKMHLEFEEKAKARVVAIHEYFWNDERKFFMDYDFVKQQSTRPLTLAGLFPLFFKLARKDQSHYIRGYVRLNFLKSGGLLTTKVRSGQQWDSPNGWAPLQWIAYQGLRNYNFNRIANQLNENWLSLIDKEFKHSGKMLEKYDVADTNLLAGGGEYENQEGFGWTNGVYLRMKRHQR